MVLVVIEGSNRDMGTTYTLLNDVIVPNIHAERILVAINRADVAMKGRHWDSLTNEPDSQLIQFLEEQASSIKRRVKEAAGVNVIKPVYYSAEHKWNVKAVFDLIMENMSSHRRGLMK